jgi:hypothetical protein
MKDILLMQVVINCISKIDSIAWKMRISIKDIYKYFCSEKLVIEEGTLTVHKAVLESIDTVVAKNHNAIKENFEIRKMFKEMFTAVDSSPIYQLKKRHPKIYNALLSKEVHECKIRFKLNIEKGIQQGLYRKDLNIGNYISFYYTLIFSANGNPISEKESNKLEFEALEYHIKTMATPKGIIELEKQIQYFII